MAGMDYLLQIGTPLLGIVGLILVLGFVGKRLNLAKPANQGPIKVLSNITLTSQVKLCLVEVGGQQLLLSVSGQQATRLHTLPERLNEDDTASPEFSQYLQSLLSRNSQ